MLVLAPRWPAGEELLLASEPLISWLPEGIVWGEEASWTRALEAVSAMPSGCVDRILWFQDGGWIDPENLRKWMVESSRLLDRNGVLLVRKPQGKDQKEQGQVRDAFWSLADRLHAEFPWVDISAELHWGAMSVAPVQEDEGGALEVDASLANEEDSRCSAYWYFCALRREETQAWANPALILQSSQERPNETAQLSWERQGQEHRRCADAARLMTARRRIGSLQARLKELGQESLAWREKERPELLCKVVELQDRIEWLREQVVDLERRGVQRVEAETLMERRLGEAQRHRQEQAQTIRELQARLETMQAVAIARAQRQEKERRAHEAEFQARAASSSASASEREASTVTESNCPSNEGSAEEPIALSTVVCSEPAPGRREALVCGAEPVSSEAEPSIDGAKSELGGAEHALEDDEPTLRGFEPENRQPQAAAGQQEPSAARREPAIAALASGMTSLRLSLEAISPDDARVLQALPEAAEESPSGMSEAKVPSGAQSFSGSTRKIWDADRWSQKVKVLRNRLGAQAPEFVTRPLSAAARAREEKQE